MGVSVTEICFFNDRDAVMRGARWLAADDLWLLVTACSQPGEPRTGGGVIVTAPSPDLIIRRIPRHISDQGRRGGGAGRTAGHSGDDMVVDTSPLWWRLSSWRDARESVPHHLTNWFSASFHGLIQRIISRTDPETGTTIYTPGIFYCDWWVSVMTAHNS